MRTSILLVLVTAAFLLTVTSATALQPFDLKCEHRINPLGIDALAPRLSWKLEQGRRYARAERQKAYQVIVASSRQLLRSGKGDLWDSGRIESGVSILVPYGGSPLGSGQQCFWKVRVWDQNNRVSSWSREAVWSMGLLQPQDWKGQWIGFDEQESIGTFTNGVWIWFPQGSPEKAAPVGTAWFRRQFELPEGRIITSAKLFLAGDDRFDAWLNGQKVGRGGTFKTVTVFDIGGRLNARQNVIAVAVSNGGSNPNPSGLVGMLRVEFETGEPLVILTDKDWRSTLEKLEGWEALDYDDSTWLSAKEIGPLGIQPWGEISMPDDRRLAARYLRKEFTLTKPVARAMVYYSGVGLSELYLNGKRTDDHVLSPGLSEYDKRVFYVTRDATDLVKQGPNALGIALGNGRFYAPRTKSPVNSKTYGFPKLLLQLQIDYEDGSSETIISDDSWSLTDRGPIRTNNEFDGEEYDARMEMPRWAEPGFTGADWRPAMLVSAPGGELRAQMIEPIRVTQTLKPISVKEISPGVHIFDMGQNMVGWCKLKVSGPSGASVKLRHAETLKPDGHLYLDNIRGALVTDIYTLSGRGNETYEPRFTYHGFRFVEVTGFPGKPTLASIEGKVVHDDLEPIGLFQSSNPLVNQIFSNIVWGVRGNYRSIPTDCPQRDERQGWLGDRSEECRGEAYIFNTAPLYAKWLQDMADAQKENGSVSDVCPSYWPLYNDNVTWPSSIAIIPGTLRDQFGDTGPIEKIYPASKKWLLHMATYIKDGLITRDTYGDWCVPPEDPILIHSKDPARKTDPALLASAYLYYDAMLLRRYALILGKTADAEQFENIASGLKATLNDRLYDKNKGYYANGSQTSCVLPLAFGITPEEECGRVFERLIDKITNESRNHIGTGLIGGQWLMRTLTRNGRADLAWTIASQDTYPSWGYMVHKGATTVWELWNGDTADPAMNSGNHVMLVGDLLTWMFEDLAGIRPDPQQPGFAHILMKPELPKGLDWVKVSHKSPYGDITSEWSRRRELFQWQVQIPPNTTAQLEIPCPSAGAVLESGKPVARANGIRLIEYRNGRQVLEAGSGTYKFETLVPKE